LATALGALAGAATNFMLNRHWSFVAKDGHLHRQAGRYALVSGLSLLLNSGGVYLVTEFGKIHYAISVVIVSLLIGVLVNFPLQKYYVFR
jgi:putative flippase GtrA